MTNENLKTLPDYLDEIVVDEYEEGLEGAIEDRVQEMMPGYEVYTWNADAQGSLDFAEEYTDILNKHLKDGIIDIQQSHWSTEDNELFLIVIAIKTKLN